MSACVASHNAESSHRLETTLRRNRTVWEILTRAPSLQLPNWYLGAGCIAQTVWNDLHGFPLTANIKDYDIVYFDLTDLSGGAEEARAEEARKLFEDLGVELDVKNEARVHLWYPDHFGYAIKPYSSTEDGISTWPTTATAIGVRRNPDGSLTVYTPFGLEDLYGLIVRPNKRQITKEIYLTKVERWKKCWPRLVVVPWESEPAVLATRPS